MDQLADQHPEVNSVRRREVDHCQLFEIDTESMKSTAIILIGN